VSTLFDITGLAAISSGHPEVTIGNMNWISFRANSLFYLRDILAIRSKSRGLLFVPDLWRPTRGARSRTNPSLHLTSVGSGIGIIGHVDAYYWASHPFRHAAEFAFKRTLAPSEIWRGMTAAGMVEQYSDANPVFSG
jgi:hypothetical protein